jgi:spore germination protein
MVIYVVKAGDTLESIAENYGVPLSRIISQNELDESRPLVVGQNIVITFPNQVYTVKTGDTLEQIAELYGVSVMSLLQNNPQLRGKTDIFEGQTIIIDYVGDKTGSMSVNGYIYPFVDRDVLIRTLPYLTYITLFTYGFMPDGSLVDRGITEYGLDENEIISLSKQYGVSPIMHLSTLTDAGVFSSELGNSILNNEQAQNILINNVINKMNEKGYYGFDVDFEYLDSSNRDKYTTFVQKLGNALRENGYILITALIPKASADQPGSLYESHDYGGLASVSDYVLLMTYEWGYTFGPPMAVAPLNEVEKVVRYALSEMPSQKIFLGVPNYAYDWPLPYESGRTKATKITNVEAVELASEQGSVIFFDSVAKCPYFNYTTENTEHVVWFDDAQSIEEKLNLVPNNNLYGVSYWNLMQWFPQNWLVLNQQYEIEKII